MHRIAYSESEQEDRFPLQTETSVNYRARKNSDREKRQAMNEFQAILVEVIFFAARFAVPALFILLIARAVHRHLKQGEDVDKTGDVQ